MKSYMCTSPYVAFTAGKVYEMTSRGLVDDDGEIRYVIKAGSLILRDHFKEVEAPLSFENK